MANIMDMVDMVAAHWGNSSDIKPAVIGPGEKTKHILFNKEELL
jgi:hypothetical protein